MNKKLLMVFVSAMSYCAVAGVGGVIVKGVTKTWDDVAKAALKASGKSVSDDAVKTTARMMEKTAAKYGDDVVKAAMRGGVEVAEQSLKHGPEFVRLLSHATNYSDDTVRMVATMVPAEDLSRVFGVVKRNPQVADQFLDAVAKGGKHFVDKIFAVNAKQILAGGLTYSMIVDVCPEIARNNPITAMGGAIDSNSERVVESLGNTVFYSIVIISIFVGLAILVFVIRKTRANRNKGN